MTSPSLCSRLWPSSSSSSTPSASCTEGSISPTLTVDSVSLVSHRDVPKLSTSRLLFVHIGYFTIVSTSLPTITSDLAASQSQYTWIGVAYMLTQTACQPLYGKVSDLVGRKNLLYTSIVIFALGSLLCGAAKTIMGLILSRAVAGIGGGGIVSSVWVITSEIVEPKHRAKWSQALSVTWSCSAIAGPLLGGLFSSRSSASSIISWRWAFYMNLPVCTVAFILLALSLRDVTISRTKGASWQSFTQKIDFLGLLLFMAGTGLLIVGFSFATSNGWTSASTISLIVIGPLILIIGGFYEVHTTRDALFPPAAFRSLTIVFILIITFFHNLVFNAGTFYLALYFQAVNGSTPLEAGIQMLPYSLGSSLASMPAAWLIGYWQKRTGDMTGPKWVITTGLFISAVGFGLLVLLDEHSLRLPQSTFPLIAGIGIGMLFHAPYQVFVKALGPCDLAAGTGAFFLVRFTGATIGLAVAGLIFDGTLSHYMPADYQIRGSSPSINWRLLSSIEPRSLRWGVLSAVSKAIQLSFFVKRYPIDERDNHVQEKDGTASDSDSSQLTAEA
ncbi:Drug:H+ antiporter-2 family protein [Tylopilus felleus]